MRVYTVLFYSGSEFCGTYKRTNNRRHVTDLNLRNNENRPSLTSSAAAEERNDVLSKNTIDEMADAIVHQHQRVSSTAPLGALCVEPTRFTRARHSSRSCVRA